MIIDNYIRFLKELKIEISEEWICVNDAKVRATAENLQLLFKCLTQFSVKTVNRNLIVLRYGLGDESALTLSEIAERVNLSEERVRQIISESLRKISHRLNKQRCLDLFLREVGKDEGVI